MKEYLTVIIVTVICILAIIGTWIWRTTRTVDKDLENKIDEYVQIYEDKVRIYDESNTSLTNTEATILTLEDIKQNAGKEKSYPEVYALMRKYVENAASLVAEKNMDDITIEYKVALDISKSGMKLTNPESEIKEIAKNYLSVDKKYDVEVKQDSNTNLVTITIKSI